MLPLHKKTPVRLTFKDKSWLATLANFYIGRKIIITIIITITLQSFNSSKWRKVLQFLNSPIQYNGSWLPTFKSQRYRAVLPVLPKICVSASIQKISSIQIHSWDTADFGIPWPEITSPFLISPHKNHWNNFYLCWICISM